MQCIEAKTMCVQYGLAIVMITVCETEGKFEWKRKEKAYLTPVNLPVKPLLVAQRHLHNYV